MSNALEIIEPQGPHGQFRFDGFDSMVHPKTTEEFYSEYWEQRPFFVRRDAPGYFDSLLTLADVDRYLGTKALHASEIRIVKGGVDKRFEDYSKDGIADAAQMMAAFRTGSMLLLSHMNRHHPPLAELLSRCEAQTHVPMRANAYLSPPGSTGFKLHWDTHDVLVLQISGAKKWHIYDNPLPLPHEEQMSELKHWVGQANKIDEIAMRPGSVLFLPRGYVHGAEAEDEHSLHITFGLRSLTVADIVLREFRRASLEDEDMRKVARLGDYADPTSAERARQALRRVIESMDLQGAIDEVHKSFIRSRQPPRLGALLEITGQSAIDHATELRLREDALYKVFKNADGISLAVDGTVLNFPGGIETAIDYVVEHKRFTPGSLPGLEHESKLLFSRSMLDCRLVERAQAA